MDLASLNLTTEQLLALKSQLDGLTSTEGRSPFRPRQLHDLRLLPTKDDPRPTFFWSAEAPRNQGAVPPPPFARLLWDPQTHQEITVHSRQEEAEKLEQGYLTLAPADAPAPDPMDALRAALDAMPEADRELLMRDQKAHRMAALTNQLASLSQEELDQLIGQTPAAKRGPGRPKKETAA